MFDHPLHSIFVHFPAGLIPVSVCFFTLFLFFRKQVFELISILLLTISLFFTLLSIASGIYDWQVRFNGYFTQIIAIKFFLSLILFLLGILIYTYRKTKIKQQGYSSLLKNYFYITLFLSLLPITATIGYFGGELVYHSTISYTKYNLDEGSKLYNLRCNSCHPYGQGIKSSFQFPGENNEEYGSPALLTSSFLKNKSAFISYLRKPNRMPPFKTETLSDEKINYIYEYLLYLKNGIDTSKTGIQKTNNANTEINRDSVKVMENGINKKTDTQNTKSTEYFIKGNMVFSQICEGCHPNGNNSIPGMEKYKIKGSQKISGGFENFSKFLQDINYRMKGSKMPVFTKDDISQENLKNLFSYLQELK
jgi:uncharacterized membrane protein/cytochrome c5